MFWQSVRVVPDDAHTPYDMSPLVRHAVDEGELLEVMPQHAKNILCGFARMEGAPVAVIANNPAHLAGCLDIDASVKAARLVRLAQAGVAVRVCAEVIGAVLHFGLRLLPSCGGAPSLQLRQAVAARQEAPPEKISGWLAAISFMGTEMPLVANPCPPGEPLPDPYGRLRPQLLWSESTMLVHYGFYNRLIKFNKIKCP